MLTCLHVTLAIPYSSLPDPSQTFHILRGPMATAATMATVAGLLTRQNYLPLGSG